MQIGLVPLHFYDLLAVLVPVILWRLTLSWARRNHITDWHNAVLAVSFWEEALFRGLMYAAVLLVWHSVAVAVIISSLLFGLFHLRNTWWADRKRVIYMCLYTGLVIGPVLALVRTWTGDIYLAILLHYLNNFVSMRLGRGQLPTDEFLRTKQPGMNWFQRLFSGYWMKS